MAILSSGALCCVDLEFVHVRGSWERSGSNTRVEISLSPRHCHTSGHPCHPTRLCGHFQYHRPGQDTHIKLLGWDTLKVPQTMSQGLPWSLAPRVDIAQFGFGCGRYGTLHYLKGIFPIRHILCNHTVFKLLLMFRVEVLQQNILISLLPLVL